MAYTFTEKKRIRKDFGKRSSILDVPYLLAIQLDSYRSFLQEGVLPRTNAWRGAFMPRSDRCSPSRATPGMRCAGVRELSSRKAHVRRKRVQASGKDIRRVAARDAAPGALRKGDGRRARIEGRRAYGEGRQGAGSLHGRDSAHDRHRHLHHQWHGACHRGAAPSVSPGVFFEHDRGKTHSSGKLLFSARVIPYRGSWLDFEFDPKDLVFVRIDRRRKLPATILLRALGYSSEEILAIFFDFNSFQLTTEGLQFKLIPERLRGEVAIFDVKDKKGKVLVEAGRRITARHINQMTKAGLDTLEVVDNYAFGKNLGRDVVDTETGEIVANANDEVTAELLENLREHGIETFETLYTNDVDRGPYMSRTLTSDSTQGQLEAQVEIYRMMRPGEPPTKEAAQALFHNLFFSAERYDISPVGRMNSIGVSAAAERKDRESYMTESTSRHISDTTKRRSTVRRATLRSQSKGKWRYKQDVLHERTGETVARRNEFATEASLGQVFDAGHRVSGRLPDSPGGRKAH